VSGSTLKIQISRAAHAKALGSYSKLANKAFFCKRNKHNSLCRSREFKSSLLKSACESLQVTTVAIISQTKFQL